MFWKIALFIMLLRYLHQFYRPLNNPSNPFPTQFQELIKIIEETLGTWIHFPNQITQHQYGFQFDVKLNTGKARGKAYLLYDHSELSINIAYPFPISEKYHESCYEFIAFISSPSNIFILSLDHRTHNISINCRITFEPSFGVLPPEADTLLNEMIKAMNLYIKGIHKITLSGISAKEAAIYCNPSAKIKLS